VRSRGSKPARQEAVKIRRKVGSLSKVLTTQFYVEEIKYMKNFILCLLLSFLLFYPPPSNPNDEWSIDPGIVPGYQAPQDRYKFLDSIDEAVRFLNDNQYDDSVMLYEIKNVPLKFKREFIKEETIKHYRNKWEK